MWVDTAVNTRLEPINLYCYMVSWQALYYFDEFSVTQAETETVRVDTLSNRPCVYCSTVYFSFYKVLQLFGRLVSTAADLFWRQSGRLECCCGRIHWTVFDRTSGRMTVVFTASAAVTLVKASSQMLINKSFYALFFLSV